MFKKLLSLFGICQPAAQTPAANEAAKPKSTLRKITRKKRKVNLASRQRHIKVNLASRQRHIKSERQRVARALQSSKASNKQSLDKANRFISGLYRRSR